MLSVSRMGDWDTMSELSAEESAAPPVVLLRLHPNLTLEVCEVESGCELTPAQQYHILKRDPLFQYSRLTVCDKCFLGMTEMCPSLREDNH